VGNAGAPAAAGRPAPVNHLGRLAAILIIVLALISVGYYFGSSAVPRCPGGWVPTWQIGYRMVCVEAAPGDR
jgi:hypothetical protein